MNALCSPAFVVDAPGIYVVQLIVNDGSTDSAPDTVTVTTVNSPPVANAGPDQVASRGDLVHLTGAGSTDVDGNPLTYAWSLTTRPAGSTAVLSSPTAVNPTFVVDHSGAYTAQLIVNDGTVDSAPDVVSISTQNQRPVANAGASQTVAAGAPVQLDGSESSDPNGDALTFKWSLLSRPQGSNAELSNATIATPTFVADVVGVYVAQLIVNDGELDSDPAAVTISTSNSKPTANGGPDQTVDYDVDRSFGWQRIHRSRWYRAALLMGASIEADGQYRDSVGRDDGESHVRGRCRRHLRGATDRH